MGLNSCLREKPEGSDAEDFEGARLGRGVEGRLGYQREGHGSLELLDPE